MDTRPAISVQNLTMAYGSFVLQRDLTFTVARGDIFVIMGGSGCGKSTLMRHLIGLKAPAAGSVWYGADNFWELDEEGRAAIVRRAGVLYQSGALWSSMTLLENVALPLQHYTDLPEAVIAELVGFKLSLVGLAGFEDAPARTLSAGQRKRLALARLWLSPAALWLLDEPYANLDLPGMVASTLREHLLASHSTPEQVGRVATEAGVGTLVLSHFVPGGPMVADETWLAAVRPHFSGRIIVARDLMTLP